MWWESNLMLREELAAYYMGLFNWRSIIYPDFDLKYLIQLNLQFGTEL